MQNSTHIKNEIGPKAFDKSVVMLGSGGDDLVTGELGELDSVLSN